MPKYTYKSETLESGIRVDVIADTDASNPAHDWDMVGQLVLNDKCRYDFGHETASREELAEITDNPNNIVLPVYMYDHSGITIRTSPFSCHWDSGQVGVIYCSREKAIREFGKKILTKKAREDVIRCMVGEIESIDNYLTGNVWGFEVYDAADDLLDSCYGFNGDPEYCLEEGMSSARYYDVQIKEDRRQTWRKALREARERHYWASRDVATL